MRSSIALAAVALVACNSQSSPVLPAAGPVPRHAPAQAAEPASPAPGAGAASTAAPGANQPPNAGTASTEPRPRAAAAVTDFALGIVRRTDVFQRGNFVISPASIALAMGITQAGARGETARQMVSVTGLSDDDHAWLAQAYGALAVRLRANRHTLESANRMFPMRGLPIEPGYQRLIHARYGAPVEPLDFAGAPEASRQRINAWVAQSTRDKIKELIQPRVVGSDTEAVLVNAMYLAATWQNAFDPDETRPGQFRTLDGRMVEVPMMQRRGGFALARSADALVVELPYAGEELVMSIVVPQGETQLPALASGLGSVRLQQLFDSVARTDSAELSLPRFTQETASHSLVQALIALGITDLFSRADLSGISRVLQGSAVSEVVHGARIEVDERGTVAAAATAVVISKSAPQHVVVDRPFLFFVRDKASGLVLFAGQVVQPSGG